MAELVQRLYSPIGHCFGGHCPNLAAEVGVVRVDEDNSVTISTQAGIDKFRQRYAECRGVSGCVIVNEVDAEAKSA